MGVLGKSEALLEAKGLENQAQSLTRGLDQPQSQVVTQPPAAATVPGDEMAEAQRGAELGAGVSFSGTPVQDYMNGLGIDKPALSDKLRNALMKMGIPKEQWEDSVDPRSGLLRVLSEFDPDGRFAEMVATEFANAKQEDGTAIQAQGKKEDAAIAQTQRSIQNREFQMKQLYSQLRQTPFMQTWPGLILFVLVSLVTRSPLFAAKLISGVGGRIAGDVDKNAVNNEIRGIQMDIRRLDQLQERQERAKAESRREAVRMMQRERERQEDKEFDVNKMYLNHKLILERAKKGTSPENRMIVSKIEGDYNRVIKRMSEAEKIMNNNWLEDDDPEKMSAKREYLQFKREADFLDQKLRALTEQLAPGTYTGAEK